MVFNRIVKLKSVVFLMVMFLSYCMVGCGKSQMYDAVYKSTDDNLVNKIAAELDMDDRKIFREAVRTRIDEVDGKLVREIIEEQRVIIREREEKERKKRERFAKLRQEMPYMVSVEVNRKFFRKGDIFNGQMYDANVFEIKRTNNYNQGIKAFKGYIIFCDLFGEKIVTVKYDNSEYLPVGSSMVETVMYECNPFIATDMKLREKKLDQMKVRWELVSIILEDGTILE